MILKGSQRSGAKQLAAHLLRLDENDHVHVHSLRGFVSNDLMGALRECYAISRGTKCKQFLFSLSLSPPPRETVTVADFEKAVQQIEDVLGLTGHQRAIVFHEKDGRRHAHVAWGRINVTTMRAVNLPRFKLKLREASRQLYIQHGWKMPAGLVDSQEANPLNFSLVEWQQAKRADRDPAKIKALFQECWAASDSSKAFIQALEARGYYLAIGDRRGYVAVDWKGEVYSISRWTAVNSKVIAERLAGAAQLPTVEQTQALIAERIAKKRETFAGDITLTFDNARLALAARRHDLVASQRLERISLREVQAARWSAESRNRAERFRKGLKGLWDRITGRWSELKRGNELEVTLFERRDRNELQLLIDAQCPIAATFNVRSWRCANDSAPRKSG